jgi:DNA-binding SARP family transcriptional activator/ABC-type glycerol-3-phosphate transport system substrate-binding protein
MLEFRILGPLEAFDGGQRLTVASGRERALLTLFLIFPNRVVTTDRILDSIWGESQPRSGAKTVAFHVARLRDALCPGRRKGDPCDVLRTEPGGYLLRVEPQAVDAARFERLASEGRALLATDAAAARSRLVEALGLWRGEALVDVRYESFAQPEIRRLDELRLRAHQDRIDADLALGSHAEVVGELEALLAANPLRERLRGQLMTALYRADRQAEALRAYDDGRHLLADELGIEPSPELEQLQRRILSQDARLSAPVSGGGPRNPYKGLRAFGEQDQADFYGREVLVDRLVARLAEVARNGRLLAVVGPSGSGKSSAVRAGLIPMIRAGTLPGSERWQVEVMYPGVDPFRELAAALDDAAGNTDPGRRERLEVGDLAVEVDAALGEDRTLLLLVIDQFEELFALVADEARRTAFLALLSDALMASDGHLLLVVTLRADAFDQPLRSPAFGELVRTGTEIVTPLSTDELERAIVRPAQSVGVELEAGLTTEVIADVARQPGELPLLQYALTELFERGDGRQLTRAGYAAIGGVLGALGRRADETLAGLELDQRETARQVFLRLVVPDEHDRPSSRRATRSDLHALVDDPAQVDQVLDAFGRARLLAFDRDPDTAEATVEVAHEALISHWPRLAAWVEQARDDIRMRRRLTDAALEWERSGRDADYLLSGNRLDGLASWAGSASLRLDRSERELLDASLAEQHRRREADAARSAHERSLERRATFRLRALVVVLVVALIGATTMSIAIYGQGETARERADMALARQLALASIASLDTDPDLSVLLAVRAADATADRGYVVEEAMDALHWAIQQAHGAYPTMDAPIAVRTGPHGLRGVELLTPAALISAATEVAGRGMTDEECRTYLHVASCPAAPAAPSGSLAVLTEAGVVPVEDLASSSLEGTSVKIVTQLPVDIAPRLAAFRERTGIALTIVSPGRSDTLTDALENELPDIVLASRPGDVLELAGAQALIPLDSVLDLSPWRSAASDYLESLGTLTIEGRSASDEPSTGVRHLYGATVATEISSLIWYPAAAFEAAGYSVPRSLDELATLVARMTLRRQTPWCLGFGAGSARSVEAGAAAADLVEELVLGRAGPDFYQHWATGHESFSARPVTDAFQALDALVGGGGQVLQGLGSAPSVPEDWAALPLTLDPPLCWLHPGGSADVRDLPPGRSATIAAFPFPFPPLDPGDTGPVRGRAYTVAMAWDRPEVRLVAGYLIGDDFARAGASAMEAAGLWPVAADAFEAEGVSAMERDLLATSLHDGTFRVDATDLMPRQLATAFQEAMLTHTADGWTAIEELLRNLDLVRVQVAR